MEPTYTKTEDGKLQIVETKEVVKEVSLEELIEKREYTATQMGFYQNSLDELDALIAKAREIGVVEKVEEVPAEIPQEK